MEIKNIKDLQQLYSGHPKVNIFADALADKSVREITLGGMIPSSAAVVFSAIMGSTGLSEGTHQVFVFVLADADEAGYFYHDLTRMMGETDVLFYPSPYRKTKKVSIKRAQSTILGLSSGRKLDEVKDGQRDAANEVLRTEVLARLNGRCSEKNNPRLLIVTHPEAVDEAVTDAKTLEAATIVLCCGETHDVSALAKNLRELGFDETDYVYEPGQFAWRGSILDVFSYSCEQPFRIDFFGDEIDSIRLFEVDTQLSGDIREQVEIVAEGKYADPDFDRHLVPFTTFLPGDTVFVVRGEVETDLEKFKRVLLKNKFTEGKGETSAVNVTFSLAPQPLYHKNFDLIRSSFEDYSLKGYKIFILADSTKQHERIRQILEKENLSTSYAAPVTLPSVEYILNALHEGFVDHDLKACFFTDHQIFDRFHKYNLKSERARSGKVALTLKEIKQFEIGDYVVHVDHGVGRFCGLLRMPQGDGYQEVIKIQYLHGDSIYVSIHSLYKVSKYKAQETGEPPRLSRLGTEQWERLKERTKTKIKDIARDLIKLYARRRRERGFAFSGDNYMQHELEASFLYEDTPDQLKATADVKADMESKTPMDRLVCGDVGFGKTEVAVRAAFKAACDSKQVAVLVPTTVLAYQHYHTFSNRLKDFPVRVDYLTRARTAKQTTEVLRDLAEGRIDIIIGTHKLIGKSVKFKDLGLLIIDEEQKFGVSTKEKLRQMKVNVDTLTMTATPIPRTLQFSLVGARDMSVIHTPPPNRYPIQTEIHPFDGEIIAEAINFEMSRNGQVFFVNNRISDLPALELLINKYVPEARVAIGHGQMKPEELEKIIMDFVNYDYDVLLCTTIIENGMDIPNANTIIINGAQNFGLSDLHQMRGRVGRSNRKAFCYLLAPPLSVLTPEARRRLEALENFSDLGSGISIAMQDLDIRGAGNLLGAEQSGFIADLGYETYQKILQQAMAELKNEEIIHPLDKEESADGLGDISSAVSVALADSTLKYVDDTTFESDMELYFPATYVPGDSERMLLYRELDSFRDDKDIDNYRARLKDRFGPIPEIAEELIRVVPLRHLCRDLGIERVTLKQGRLTLFFVSNENSPYYESTEFDAILEYVVDNPKRCNIRENNGKRSLVIGGVTSVREGVEILKGIKDSVKHQSS